MISIIIPSRTDEYLQVCLDSMERSQPRSTNRVHVVDNGLSKNFRDSWKNVTFINYEGKFVFSKAINLGVSKVPRSNDLLLLNDDIEILYPKNFLTILENYLSTCPEFIGLIGFKIWITGSPTPVYRGSNAVPIIGKVVGAPSTLIPRRVWESVGEFDERFVEYGMEDNDYCRRVRSSGLLTVDTHLMVVKHGMGGHKCTSTFFRLYGESKVSDMYRHDRGLYKEKWGDLRE